MRHLRILVLILISSGLLHSCKVGRFFIYNFADIQDHKKFPSRTAHNDSITFQFALADNGRVPKGIRVGEKNYPFEPYLKDNKTVAFLIIQNDTIQYEKHFRGYDQSSIVPSFSIAKSITSI